MSKKTQNYKADVVRKATPEEVARYNALLEKESNRLRTCRDLGVSTSVNLSVRYSSTAITE